MDWAQTHMWKPLLHEVAAGSMDVHAHQLDYLAQARWHHFTFCHGPVEGLFARFMYLTLYKQHRYALHGLVGVLLDTLARLLKRGTEPKVKLH